MGLTQKTVSKGTIKFRRFLKGGRECFFFRFNTSLLPQQNIGTYLHNKGTKLSVACVVRSRHAATQSRSNFSFTEKDRLINRSRHAATVQHQRYPSSSSLPRETKTLAMTRGMPQLQESDKMARCGAEAPYYLCQTGTNH